MSGVIHHLEPMATRAPGLLEQERLLRVLVVALGEDEVDEQHIQMLRSIRYLPLIHQLGIQI